MTSSHFTFGDKVALENVALALIAYAKEAEQNPELARMLDRVAVPGGYDVRDFANKAAKLSSARRPDYEHVC